MVDVGLGAKITDVYRIVKEVQSSQLVGHCYLIEPLASDSPRLFYLLYTLNDLKIKNIVDRQKFFKARRHLLALQHPHIQPILVMELDGEIPYIITEYLDCPTLQDLIDDQGQQENLDVHRDVIISQIGLALEYLHEHSMNHGQISPEAVIVKSVEQCQITGYYVHYLAVLFDRPLSNEITDRKQEHSVYCAPEQVKGEVLPASDQYALGCLAYELYTGRKPFLTPSASRPGTSFKMRTLLSPRTLNSSVPEAADQAILRAMSSKPEDRYPSISAFLRGLDRKALTQVLILVSSSIIKTGVPVTPRLLGPTLQTEAVLDEQHLNQKPIFLPDETRKDILGTPGEMELKNSGTSSFSDLETSKSPELSTSPARRFTKGRYKFLSLGLGSLVVLLCLGLLVALVRPLVSTAGNHPKVTRRIARASAVATVSAGPRVTPTAAVSKSIRGASSIVLPQKPLQPTPSSPTVSQTVVPFAQPTPNGPTATQPPVNQPTPGDPVVKAPVTTPTTPALAIPADISPINPKVLSPGNCPQQGSAYICQVTLTTGPDMTDSISWYTYASGVDVQANPSSGVLQVGQSVGIQLNVHANCPSFGSIYFVENGTAFRDIWNC